MLEGNNDDDDVKSKSSSEIGVGLFNKCNGMQLHSFNVVGREPTLSSAARYSLPPSAFVHFKHRDDLQYALSRACNTAGHQQRVAHLIFDERQLRRFQRCVIEQNLGRREKDGGAGSKGRAGRLQSECNVEARVGEPWP